MKTYFEGNSTYSEATSLLTKASKSAGNCVFAMFCYYFLFGQKKESFFFISKHTFLFFFFLLRHSDGVFCILEVGPKKSKIYSSLFCIMSFNIKNSFISRAIVEDDKQVDAEGTKESDEGNTIFNGKATVFNA